VKSCALCGVVFKPAPNQSAHQLFCSHDCARSAPSTREYMARARARRRSPVFAADPVFGQLHDLAANAQAMTPALWAHKLANFQRHPAASAVPRVGEKIA
jgi:hypothetical protein